ncbi:hypothetical protein Ancab_014841 [Ancistrocladus abbreviatus]
MDRLFWLVLFGPVWVCWSCDTGYFVAVEEVAASGGAAVTESEPLLPGAACCLGLIREILRLLAYMLIFMVRLVYMLSTMAGKHLSQITSDAQGSQDVATDWILTETCNLLRLAPETTQNIEEFVLKFYESLPSTTIVCLCLLGGAYPMLLQKFLPHRPVHAWMLLSNLNALSEPVVILIPLDYVLQAPMFKSILRGNYASSLPIEDAERNLAIWWMARCKGMILINAKTLEIFAFGTVVGLQDPEFYYEAPVASENEADIPIGFET